MRSYKVYGDSISGNCLKVKWTLDLLDQRYKWVETSVLKGETRTAEYLGLNPAGQVPLLITPDGQALAQSNAILLYLAEKHGGEVLPTAAFDRAKVYEWLFWEQYSHEPYIAVRRFLKAFLGKSDLDIDPKLLERGNAALTRMERQLEAAAFIAGEKFSVADISLVAYTRTASSGGFELGAFPRVKAWIATVEKRLGIGTV